MIDNENNITSQNGNSNNQMYQSGAYLPQGPAYPAYPPTPNIWAMAPAFQFGACAIQAERDRANAAIENFRLRDKRMQRILSENAYTVAATNSGRTYTVGKNGQLIELVNQEIEGAWRFCLQPPFPEGSFYGIKLRGIEQEIELDSQQFHRDTALIQAFQELPGVEVRPCRSVKLTATLLRQAICQRLQAVEQPFYAGWRPGEAGGFNFWAFKDGATHVREKGANSPISLGSAMTAAAMTAAVQRFLQELNFDLTQPHQWFLSSMFHISAIFSLLRQMEHPFPLSLCVLVENAGIRSWLTSFFRRFHDVSLSLSLPPADFSDGLLCRKDQAVVILDERGDGNARKNTELLEGILTSHLLPWKDRREEKFTPLQALPVILSTTASALTVNPDCMTLELPKEFPCSGSKISEDVVSDYLLAFTQYTAAHIERLRQLLDGMENRAFECAVESTWPAHYVKAIGIVLAIDHFVREFHAFCGFDIQDLNKIYPDAELWLRELVDQTADKLLNCGDLAAQFVEVASTQLQNGPLNGCPMGRETDSGDNVVYFDEDYLAFTVSATNTVCHSMGQSRPLVLRALAEAGLLRGKPVNNGTFLTRIGVWNAYGVRRSERVYLFDRDVFEQLGTPLLFEGEELS